MAGAHEAAQQRQARSFFKTYIVPLLFVLVIPLTTLGFTSYQFHTWDELVRSSVYEALDQQQQRPDALDAEGLIKAQAAIDAISMSANAVERCGVAGFFQTPDGYSEDFCSNTLQFVWARAISVGLLALTLLVALFLGATLLWARREPHAQRRAFSRGWHTLRLFSIPHMIGQGALALFLSFWVTAVLFEVYYPMLILGLGLIVLIGIGAALVGLYSHEGAIITLYGAPLSERDAPTLFRHIGELARELGTTPPRVIVVTSADHIFVTEIPLVVQIHPPRDQAQAPSQAPTVKELTERALCLSLPLMRSLTREELSALIAHELSHFVDGEASQARLINQHYHDFDLYLSDRTENITFGVASLMRAYRAIFAQLSQRHERVAERAADAAAQRVVDATSLASALIKHHAYTAARDTLTHTLLTDTRDTRPLNDLAARVDARFTALLATAPSREALASQRTAHPTDTHPPLSERLAQLSQPPLHDPRHDALSDPATTSWYDTLPNASALEASLWEAYLEGFHQERDLNRALLLQPTTEEEIAHVERYFPEVIYPTSSGGEVRISWRGITLEDGVELPFAAILAVERQQTTLQGDLLIFKTQDQPVKLKLKLFQDNGQQLTQGFDARWNRHHIAQNHASDPSQV